MEGLGNITFSAYLLRPAAGILRSLAKVANTVSLLEDQASKECAVAATPTAPASQCVIPANVDAVLDKAFIAYTNASDEAMKRILDKKEPDYKN